MMVEYFINGIAFTAGVFVCLCALVALSDIKYHIEKNKRCGRKWWKI